MGKLYPIAIIHQNRSTGYRLFNVDTKEVINCTTREIRTLIKTNQLNAFRLGTENQIKLTDMYTEKKLKHIGTTNATQPQTERMHYIILQTIVYPRQSKYLICDSMGNEETISYEELCARFQYCTIAGMKYVFGKITISSLVSIQCVDC